MPLTGTELLDALRALPKTASKSERCRVAGYVRTNKDGSERLNFTGFYQALIEAQGISLGSDTPKRKGRTLTYQARVGANGVVVGTPYLDLIDAPTGSVLQIEVKRRNQIVLTLSQPED